MLPTSFIESGGAVVVNFGILAGREATIAEVDRLAHSLGIAGGTEISIVAARTQRYGESIETVVHQVVVDCSGVPDEQLERLCKLWTDDCAGDRRLDSF